MEHMLFEKQMLKFAPTANDAQIPAMSPGRLHIQRNYVKYRSSTVVLCFAIFEIALSFLSKLALPKRNDNRFSTS